MNIDRKECLLCATKVAFSNFPAVVIVWVQSFCAYKRRTFRTRLRDSRWARSDSSLTRQRGNRNSNALSRHLVGIDVTVLADIAGQSRNINEVFTFIFRIDPHLGLLSGVLSGRVGTRMCG